eukprot:988959_1
MRVLIIVDRRKDKDVIYVAEYQNFDRLNTLNCNYFVGITFEILYGVEVSAYLMYGIHERLRFFPELLTSIVPRLFKANSRLNPHQYVSALYSPSYKQGFCLNLNTTINFNMYYKRITTTTHVSVNYNRQHVPIINLDDESTDDCVFADSQTEEKDEVECSCGVDNQRELTECVFITYIIKSLKRFRDCKYRIGKKDRDEFDLNFLSKCYDHIITVHCFCFNLNERTKIQKFICDPDIMGPCPMRYKCVVLHNHASRTRENRSETVHDRKPKSNHMVSTQQRYIARTEILSATMNSLHSYLVHTDAELFRLRDEEIDPGLRFSSAQEGLNEDEEANSNHIEVDKLNTFLRNNDIKDRTLSRFNHWCKINEYDSDALNEDILYQDDSYLHAYFHGNKIGIFFNLMIAKYVKDDNQISQKEFNSLNFGISVLNWLDFDEKPTNKNLKDELLAVKVDPYDSKNDQQYVDEELYENYKQQALIKINTHADEHWSLNEMLSLKVYSDATAFQTAFRKAFWKLLHDDHEVKKKDKINKKQYYWWALNLYRTALFHAKPVPQRHAQSTSPCTIFHGLNNVFIVEQSLPIYNGPISTTLTKTVAHTFSEEKGLLWTITPSYTNQFRFIVGIQMDWISHFIAEAEILLVNQYLPIGSTENFEENTSNKVDQLMLQLQKFKHEITNKHRFFKQIGFAIKNDDHEMIALISKHVSLFARCKYKNTIVLRRLITELEVPLPDLEDLLTIHESYVFAEVLTKHLVLHEDKFISLDNMSDIDEKYIKEILDMKFIVVENSNQSHIKNVGNRHVYKFADIREWYMLIPFKQDKDVFSVYVRTEQIFSFLLLKTFTIKSSTHEVTNETRLLKQYKMNHLLTTLKVLNFKIVNDELFYRQIGCVIVSDCIAIIKRKTSLLYASTVFGQNTVLHRLVEELKITILSNLLKVYLSKWEYFGGYSVFNYCSYKLRINVNYGAAQTDFLFQNCEYRLVHDSDHQNINNRIISNFNQEMVIKNTYSVIQNTNVVSNAYTVYVRNAALFGVNDWVVLQHLDIDFGEYTNLFLADLYLMHNQLVTLKQKRDVALGGDDGEYDLVTTASKHRIYAKSNRPTVRASVALYTLHWYFEVHIIKKQADQHVWIGFANADFKPNDKKHLGVGCDINSWASNGSTTLHGNETSNTRLREWTSKRFSTTKDGNP